MVKASLLIAALRHILAILVALSTIGSSSATMTQQKTDLYIVAMLPYPLLDGTHSVWQATREDGPDIAPAVYLAVDQINNRMDILNNYTLHVIESDGACNIRTRTYVSLVQALYDLSLERRRVVGIVGPACSDSAEVVASLSSTSHLPVVSLHLGSDPMLSQYPHSFGIVDSRNLYVNTLIQLVIYSNWSQVSIVYSEADIEFFSMYEQVHTLLEVLDVNIHLALPVSDTYMPLQSIDDAGIRIIISFTELRRTLQLMCLAYHVGLIFPAHQWVFIHRGPEYFSAITFHYDGRDYSCSDQEMQEVAEGSLVMFLDLQVDDDTVTVSGQTYSQYLQDYSKRIKHYRMVHNANSMETVWANPIYDATWALALALNESLAARDERNVAQLVTEELYKINFTGVSGLVAFDRETSFSMRTMEVFQFSNGTSRAFGYYNKNAGFVLKHTPIIVSSEFKIDKNLVVSPVFKVCCLIIVGIPLVPTVFAHVMSCVYRRFKAIKVSSYKLNQLAYIGFYMFIVGLVILVTHGEYDLSSTTHDRFCVITVWIDSMGPSLVLATICMESVRLYRLYTGAQTLKPITHKFLLKDSILALGVLLLLLPEVTLLTVRTIYDPPQWKELAHSTTSGSHVRRATFGCIGEENMDTAWFLVETGYWSLVAFYTCWLAHNSRKLEEKGFHVKNVITLVYIVAFATLCIIPPALYVTGNTTPKGLKVLYYIAVSYFAILIHSSVTLLFIPPVIVLFKSKWKLRGQSFWSTTPSVARARPKTEDKVLVLPQFRREELHQSS